MADLPLDVLVQEQSKEELQATLLALAGSLGLKTTQWQSGGMALTIIGLVAQVLAGMSKGVALIARSGFLDLSNGPFLTLVAHYLYGVDRTEAITATGPIVVTNASGALYKYRAGTFVVGRQAPNQVTYVNAEAFTLEPVGNPGAQQTISFRAQVQGGAGTAPAGSITRLVSSAPGVTVANPSAFIGANEEIDRHLRARCKAKLGSLSPNGPSGSYQYVATSATDGAGDPLGVTRIQKIPNLGDGNVRVFLAGPSGAVSPDVVLAVDDMLQRLTVPDAVRLTTASATNVTIDVTAVVYVYSAANLSPTVIKQRAAGALDDFFRLLPVGGMALVSGGPGYVLFRALEAQLAQISPLVVQARVTPETDVALMDGQVAAPGIYTLTVEIVEGP